MGADHGEPLLRIRIRENAGAITFNAPYRSATATIPSGRFVIGIRDSKIELANDQTSVHIDPHDIFQPVESHGTISVPDTRVGEGFHWSHSEDLTYPGGFTTSIVNGKIIILSIVPLEEYLSSVISSEMNSVAPSSFLKAHAVVSRSWVLAQLGTGKNRSTPENTSGYEIWEWHDREDHEQFDFCNDDHCQRYHGLSRQISPGARNAVKETRGTVLHAGNRVVDTRFSKCCGGISERFSTAWQDIESPGITSILDAPAALPGFHIPIKTENEAQSWIKGNPAVFCNVSKTVWDQITIEMDKKTTGYFRWTVSYEQDELAEIVECNTSAGLGAIRGIDILKRGPSCRAIAARIHGEKDSISIGKELTIRRILSRTHLKSSAIIIEPGRSRHGTPQSFTIYGAGWGHGVGMCQIGAGAMAVQGHDFRSILSHYFPTAELRILY